MIDLFKFGNFHAGETIANTARLFVHRAYIRDAATSAHIGTEYGFVWQGDPLAPVWVDARDVAMATTEYDLSRTGVYSMTMGLDLMELRGLPWWRRLWRVRYCYDLRHFLALAWLADRGWVDHKEGESLNWRRVRWYRRSRDLLREIREEREAAKRPHAT